MPVAGELVGTRVHLQTRLAREEEQDKRGKEEHVSRKGGKQEEPDAVREFEGAAALIFPLVVPAAATTAGRPPVHGRFAADSRLFPFRLRRGARKGRGH